MAARSSAAEAGRLERTGGKPSARGVPARRRTQAERRVAAERAILAAALKIVGERGIDALTLTGAGEAAGFSRALPGHYFPGRDVLLARLADFVVEKYLRRVQRDAPRQDGLEGLLRRMAHYMDDGRKDPVVLRGFHAVMGAAPNVPALALASAKLTQESRASYARLIRAGVERGEIRAGVTPELEATWILAALRGVMAAWVIAPNRTPLTRVKEAFLASVRRALER